MSDRRAMVGGMTTEPDKPVAYPEFDENGKRNPVRVPATEESEAWELEIMEYSADYDPYDHETLANEPN